MRVLILSLSNTQQHTILSFLQFFSYSKSGKTLNYLIPLLLFHSSFFFFLFFCFTRLRANLQFQSSFSLIYVSTNCTSTPPLNPSSHFPSSQPSPIQPSDTAQNPAFSAFIHSQHKVLLFSPLTPLILLLSNK